MTKDGEVFNGGNARPFLTLAQIPLNLFAQGKSFLERTPLFNFLLFRR